AQVDDAVARLWIGERHVDAGRAGGDVEGDVVVGVLRLVGLRHPEIDSLAQAAPPSRPPPQRGEVWIEYVALSRPDRQRAPPPLWGRLGGGTGATAVRA